MSPKQAELKLVVRGRIPSKKNSRNIFVRGGRICNIPSTKYAAWHKAALEQLIDYSGSPITKCTIELSFYAPDKRGTDLTNKAESIMDLLVDREIIEDDNWWIVDRVCLMFKGVDKRNPRCEVSIFTERHTDERL
jgi:hypothetical protein